jgi:SpoVK/Ycf46/Vps4 family AAA+-type ATPase
MTTSIPSIMEDDIYGDDDKVSNPEIPSDELALQYTRLGGAYVPVGKTVSTLPPGFYEVTLVNGQPAVIGKTVVSDSLIDIDGTVADDFFDDMNVFLDTQADYEAFGLTHKRGYLVYGPPGSGKTSIGIMLARRFAQRAKGVVFFISDPGALYNAVNIMKTVEPGRPSMYLIEEADSIINSTECLSILDGELSIRGAIFVAMTNHKERLPPRIANRPGRFDRVECVDCPPTAIQIEYLRRVMMRRPEGLETDLPQKIVAALDGIPVSMAHLREAFISHVLMGTTLQVIRARFLQMADIVISDLETNIKFEAEMKEPWMPSGTGC